LFGYQHFSKHNLLCVQQKKENIFILGGAVPLKIPERIHILRTDTFNITDACKERHSMFVSYLFL